MPVTIDISSLLEECLPGSEHEDTRAEILGKLATGRRRQQAKNNHDDSTNTLDSLDFDLLDIFHDDDDDEDSVLGDMEDFSESNDKGDLALYQKRSNKNNKVLEESYTASTDDESESTTASSE